MTKFYDLTKNKPPVIDELERLDNLESYKGKWRNHYFYPSHPEPEPEVNPVNSLEEANVCSARQIAEKAMMEDKYFVLHHSLKYGLTISTNTCTHAIALPEGGQ